MTPLTPIDILSRWVHVSTAAVVLGSVFFLVILLPAALSALEPEARDAAYAKARRITKMVFHSGILLFLLTGIYNAVRAWPKYNQRPGVTHGLFGVHLLLGLAIFAIGLVQFAGAKPLAPFVRGMRWVVVLLFVSVLAASSLKWAREWAHDHPKVRATAISRPNG